MVGVYEPIITNCRVANLGNSSAITFDLRLAFGNSESHIRSPRTSQRFLKSLLETFRSGKRPVSKSTPAQPASGLQND